MLFCFELLYFSRSPCSHIGRGGAKCCGSCAKTCASKPPKPSRPAWVWPRQLIRCAERAAFRFETMRPFYLGRRSFSGSREEGVLPLRIRRLRGWPVRSDAEDASRLLRSELQQIVSPAPGEVAKSRQCPAWSIATTAFDDCRYRRSVRALNLYRHTAASAAYKFELWQIAHLVRVSGSSADRRVECRVHEERPAATHRLSLWQRQPR